MRKIGDEKLAKIMDNDDNKKSIDDFLRPEGIYTFLFAIPSGDNLSFTLEPPPAEKIKKHILLVIRTHPPSKGETPVVIDHETIEKEVVFMEVSKHILENLYMVCSEVYMPVMSNPLNMAGWSDLVSKDLMDKFHGFLAHTYVTIG
mmetsp:Transcript_20734/g.31862  ORF Transcript_20734/g.31862 Transcript_20734/m.31862 type:complete len:146 (+) Transcript_20734:3-440(+)